MGWSTTHDVAVFLERAGAFLCARPAENTLPLTVADTLRQAGDAAFGEAPPRFGWWHAGDGVVGAAYLQTPPRAMLLTRGPDAAIASLAGTLAAAGHHPSSISADRSTADAFAAAWCARTGARARTEARLRLYRLGTLVTPDAAGAARVAGPADRDLLVRWWREFHRDIGEEPNRPEDSVTDKMAYGGLMLWEVDGVPVAMAGYSRPLAGMVRVMAVYTPPGLRRRGYAGAVTAAVSRAALDRAARQVVLYTDLDNPTSNALYQRLGYRPVEDRIVLSFAS